MTIDLVIRDAMAQELGRVEVPIVTFWHDECTVAVYPLYPPVRIVASRDGEVARVVAVHMFGETPIPSSKFLVWEGAEIEVRFQSKDGRMLVARHTDVTITGGDVQCV